MSPTVNCSSWGPIGMSASATNVPVCRSHAAISVQNDTFICPPATACVKAILTSESGERDGGAAALAATRGVYRFELRAALQGVAHGSKDLVDGNLVVAIGIS